jgi:BASS family bile acid:Na+ symporter
MMTTITTLFLPAALAVIMLGLGLSLTVGDFQRVARAPKAVTVALIAQVLVLPAVAFGLCHLFRLPPEMSVGLMLLAASPGGTSANLFSHLAHGDVALNVTLTAVNSVLAIVTLPILLGLSLTVFMGEAREVGFQYGKLVQVVIVVIAPVGLGMLVRRYRPTIAARADAPVRKLSVLLLAMIIALVLVQSHKTIAAHLLDAGGAALSFNLLSLAAGYWLPRLLGLARKQCIAIGMEIGVHNSGLAITLALSPLVLNNPAMAIPATLYSPIMMITAGTFAAYLTRRKAGPEG